MLPSTGDRIRLIHMPDDPDPIPSGSEGTVLWADDMQIVVDWDVRRSLNLIPGVDRWEFVSA